MGYGPVRFAPLLSIAAGSITASYTTLGTTTKPARIVVFINATDAPVFLSFNATDDNVYLEAGSAQTFDLQSNSTPNQNNFGLDANTVVSIKRVSGAPSTGSVYVQVIYPKS